MKGPVAIKSIKSVKELIDLYNLEENSYYMAWVQCNAGNPPWQTLIRVGFKTGGYFYIYNGNGGILTFHELYTISIIKKISPDKIESKHAENVKPKFYE